MNKIQLFVSAFVIVIIVGQEPKPSSDKESHYEEQEITTSAYQKTENQLAGFYGKGGEGGGRTSA